MDNEQTILYEGSLRFSTLLEKEKFYLVKNKIAPLVRQFRYNHHPSHTVCQSHVVE